ncbi:MAG: amino acid adenylation domain-containing protein, partial [Gemmatimonadota bacterium]
MTELHRKYGELSPQRRELLGLLLKEKGVDLAHALITPRGDPDAPAPLSYAQERMWFLDQFEPGSAVYNIPTAVRLEGDLNVAWLERAIDEVVRRHEALRTTFAAVDGRPVQVISPATSYRLPVEDVTPGDGGSSWDLLLRRIGEEARRPFDLAAGPLLRSRLFRLSERDHVISLVMHHVVSDGWSAGILVREVVAVYAALATGSDPDLRPLPVQYADFAEWQREWLGSGELARQLAHWTSELGARDVVLDLPTDRPRPAVLRSRGASASRRLDRDLADDLNDLAHDRGATLFMTLLAAFQVLLHRYAGQDEIRVGTPVANRSRPETQDLIGLFVNTLVLRADLSDDPTFRDHLSRVRETSLQAFAHLDLPFEKLVEALQPERAPSHTPLFQVMFSLQNEARGERSLPGLVVRGVPLAPESSAFDLSLAVQESRQGLTCGLECNTDLFEPSTAESLLRRYETLLRSIVRDPDLPVSRLPILTREERELVLVEWNRTGIERPSTTVHELFAAQARRTPGAIAVEQPSPAGPEGAASGTVRMTYGELDARSTRLARDLRQLGVPPDAAIGLCVRRSPDLIVSLLAILKAGGAYLPLDPEYPEERLRFMVRDAGVELVIAEEALAPRFASTDVRVVCPTPGPADAGEPGGSPETGRARPDDLAYVIYTSGSTGTPKGVEVEHRSLLNHALAAVESFELSGQDRVLQFATINFDAAAEEIFPTLATGGTLVLRPGGALPTPSELTALAERERLTVLDLPTAYWHAWIADLERSGAAVPPHLRLVVIGGEQASAERFAAWRRLSGSGRVRTLNTYGPTEATIVATLCCLDDVPADRSLPIGRPLPNGRAYVLDRHGEPVPVGVPGELYIGGVPVARGYRNRPNLTVSRFLPDPLGGAGRLYRTGDRVRWRPDGLLEFLGRVDDQVKIRGFRVEPGEVQAVVEKAPFVRRAAVVPQPDPGGTIRLVAYVVPTVEGEPESVIRIARWREHARAALPDYMVPAVWMEVDEIPLTATGKVDRRALPEPRIERTSLEERYVAPRTPEEELLAGIFSDLLDVKGVGALDDFFHLGGHSLLATRVVSRVREALGVDVPLPVFFEAPTVAGLARAVGERRGASRGLPPVRPVSREGKVPLSFGQQRLWFLDQLDPGSPVYNIPSAVRLEGDLDPGALRGALRELVARHEVLRTRFASEVGRPFQVIEPEVDVDLPVEDLSGLAGDVRESELAVRIRQEATAPFDLGRAPLMRARLVRLAEREHVAVIVLHHIVSDGWSSGILVGELAELYRARVAGDDVRLPPLDVQYADYAAWQRTWLDDSRLRTEIEWWREALETEDQPGELATDRPRPPVQTSRGAVQSFHLDAELTRKLEELARRSGATPYMTLLAGFFALLHRYTGSGSLRVGTPVAGRNRAEIERLIGFFVNTLVVPGDVSDDPGFSELIARVRRSVLGALEHQSVPFEKVVDELEPDRDLSRTPLFQAMFVLQNLPRQSLELPGLRLAAVAIEPEVTPFDLTLGFEETPEGLSGAVEYNADLFEAATIERLIAHYRTLLDAAVAQPDLRVSELPLMGEEEQATLGEWAGSERPLSPGRTVHALVEERARTDPAAVAVVQPPASDADPDAGGRHLTYRELDRRASVVARHLLRQGVERDQRVGVLLERSLDQMVALLAVLKSGGAYVPLDPSNPDERLRFMAADSALRFVVTSETLAARVPASALPLVLEAMDREIPGESGESPEVPEDPTSLAYAIYTSGSTGTPKAVGVEHRSVVNHNLAVAGLFGLSPADRVLQFASVTFDAAVEEIFPTWIAGARLVLRPDRDLPTAEALLALVRSEGITVLDLPTAYWHALTSDLTRSGERLPDSLRLVILGGERASVERLRLWREIRGADHVTLLNTYGPTETTVVATAWKDDGGPLPGEVPIGRPLPNVRCYVLDGRLRPVPVGVPGE